MTSSGERIPSFKVLKTLQAAIQPENASARKLSVLPLYLT
jgi:hypothetical protein